MASDIQPLSEKTIETVMDRLYDLVRAKQSTTTKEVADALSISEAQAEKLARLLESSKLVSVNYTLSETTISVPQSEVAAEAQKAREHERPEAQEILAACEEASRAKNMLELSQRQLSQAARRLRDISGDAKRMASSPQRPIEVSKRLDRLSQDAVLARGAAAAMTAQADELSEAVMQLEGKRPEQQKGAKR